MKAYRSFLIATAVLLGSLGLTLVIARAPITSWITSSFAVSISLLIGYLLARRIEREKSQQQIIPFDTQALAQYELSHLIYLRCANIEDLALSYGIRIKDSLIEILHSILRHELRFLSINLYRYEDSSFIITIEQRTHIDTSTIEREMRVLANRLRNSPIPIAAVGVEIAPILHIGILPIAEVDEDFAPDRHLQYAKLPLFLSKTSISEISIKVFDKGVYGIHKTRVQRQRMIPEIIHSERIETVYQPIVECSHGTLYGYEALSRPMDMRIDQLLENAEASRLYVPTEVYLTYAAVTRYVEATRHMETKPTLFLNLAPTSIDSQAYDTFFSVGLFNDLPFVFEIIERGEIVPQIVNELRKRIDGCANAQVALDDFGTGYSNHLALLNARPDIIKVSRELLSNIDIDVEKQHIYSNIVQFARNVRTRILAEGVETETEFLTLLELGMDYAQGWFIEKPAATLTQNFYHVQDLCTSFRDSGKASSN